MNLIRELMEYGELRLWSCEHFHYAELHLEIPTDGCAMLLAKDEALESALAMLRDELVVMRG